MTNTQTICKIFDELTKDELYEILRVRSEVFVIEQQCNYQDMDYIDYRSRHIFIKNENDSIIAYLRLFMKKDEEKTAQIGRVLTTERGKGLGAAILRRAISEAKNTLNADEIFLESQQYAIGFYEKEGFIVKSGVFLDVGIPHVEMRLTL